MKSGAVGVGIPPGLWLTSKDSFITVHTWRINAIVNWLDSVTTSLPLVDIVLFGFSLSCFPSRFLKRGC